MEKNISEAGFNVDQLAAAPRADFHRTAQLMQFSGCGMAGGTKIQIDLERLIQAARQAGAYGAKLSGGGRGGNMIALAPGDAAGEVAEALTKASAKSSLVTVVSS